MQFTKNIGLQANILSTRTFTIFVVMALLTTFATTPITTLLYPPWYQKKIAAWKRGEIEWDSSEDSTGAESALAPQDLPTNNRIGQLLVYLRLDNMPGLLNLVSLFGQEASESNHAGRNQETLLSSDEKSPASAPTLPVKAHGLRLLTLGDRDSSVMTVSEVEEHNKNDPVVNTWRIVGQLLRVGVSGEVATMVENRFAEAILTKSASISADLLLLPWSSSGSMGDTLEHVPANRAGTTQYVHFTKQILDAKAHNVGIFFPEGGPTTVVGGQAADKGLQLQRAYSFTKVQAEIQPLPVKNKAHQIILPYFGGDDDKFALMLVLQLCEKTGASAKVIHLYGVEPARLRLVARRLLLHRRQRRGRGGALVRRLQRPRRHRRPGLDEPRRRRAQQRRREALVREDPGPGLGGVRRLPRRRGRPAHRRGRQGRRARRAGQGTQGVRRPRGLGP